ncbi:MAG: GNAT family N-acetyltransferase [Myxococcota bacterium]|nr:GNAT family N-acetyltransferase [Myxococcota bacterium]
MMRVRELETPRLRLRPYTAADRGWFVETFGDAVVMAHVGGAMSEDAAGALFDAVLEGTRDRVFAAWCAESDEGVVGHGALLREGEELELGYVLPQHAWGRGYATEIAGALVSHALDTLGRARVLATVDADHSPSLRVLTKVGMVVRERVDDPEGAYLRCST